MEEEEEKKSKKEAFETKIYDMANSIYIEIYQVGNDAKPIGTAKKFLYQLCRNFSEETFEIKDTVKITMSIDYKSAVNNNNRKGGRRAGPVCIPKDNPPTSPVPPNHIAIGAVTVLVLAFILMKLMG